MSAQHESKTERDDDSDLEDVFEAFIFILYNDIGPKNTRQFIRNFIEEETDWVVLDKMYRNYKQKLSQHLTKQGLSQPLYEQLPMNNVCKKYRVKVKDSYDRVLGVGEGKTKTKAEQEASRSALLNYGII